MTSRQEKLLMAIINEFIQTANAVGSLSLYDKYRFNVSPATIRNEMATLVSEGYLQKPHSSSGRVPTTLGLRHFISKTSEEFQELDILTQEEIKQHLHAMRFDRESMLRESLRALSKLSGNASVAVIDRDIYYAGLSEMLDIPEFQELDNLKVLLTVLEDYSRLSSIFNMRSGSDEVKVLIGEETGLDELSLYAVIFSELRLHGGKNGYLAIIGPNRMDYQRLIPAVGFFARTINRLAGGW